MTGGVVLMQSWVARIGVDPNALSARWRRAAVAAYIGLNIALLLMTAERPGPHNTDWSIWVALADQPIYEARVNGVPFLYSPVAAWILAAVAHVGYWPWFALHFAALWFLRFSPLVLGLTLVSWGFWVDAIQGNAFTFILVAGVLAVRGSRSAGLVSIALFCLAPRPLQVPLLAWLLWTRPDIRFPAVVIAAAHTLLAAASGDLATWIGALADIDDSVGMKFGPTFIGTWWYAAALPVAVWLTWKGRVGLAGLTITPYLLPQYALIGLITKTAMLREPTASIDPIAVSPERVQLIPRVDRDRSPSSS